MIVDRTITLAAPANETFRRVMDIPFVGSCLPGASDIRPAGEDAYQGNFAIKVGPVNVSLDGTVRIATSNERARRALFRLNGNDRRIGGTVVGDMDIRVVESGDYQSELVVHTEVIISGKLGQFGQAVMVKKADQITSAFVDEFSRRMVDDLALEEKLIHAAAVGGPEQAAVTPGSEIRQLVGMKLQTTSPLDVVTPLYAIVALLRRGRRLRLVDSPESIEIVSSSPNSAQFWVGRTAVTNGLTGAVVGERDYVVALQAGDAGEVAHQWESLSAAQLDMPVAVAVLPTGEALRDPTALRELCISAGQISARPVLVVAGTPWGVLPLTGIIGAGDAHGLVVDASVADGYDVSAMMRLAVAEVRRAKIDCPIIAGPTAGKAEEAAFRAAGADAVLVGERRRKRRFVRRDWMMT